MLRPIAGTKAAAGTAAEVHTTGAGKTQSVEPKAGEPINRLRREVIQDVLLMIDAGLCREAPYPDADGRLWQEYTPTDIVEHVKRLYGPEWAKYIAGASALTIH